MANGDTDMSILNDPKLRSEVARAVRNNRYERSDNGVWVPLAGGLNIHGMMTHWVNGQDEQVDPNIVTTQGMNHLLSSLVVGFGLIQPWYIAPYTGSITPVVGTTALTFDTVCTELTQYDEATRQLWSVDALGAGVVLQNDASRANFTINASVTATGCGILSAPTKESTSGVLLAYANFNAPRVLVDDDILTIRYTITASSS